METFGERILADNKEILNSRGLTAEMTFTAPNGSTQALDGTYTDVSLGINPETGLPIIGRKISISAHLPDFTTYNPADTAGNWKVSFVNNIGETITGYLKNIMPDRTLGMVTATVEKLKAAS